MEDYNVEGRLITKDDWEKWLKSKEEESAKKESRYAVIEWHKYPQEDLPMIGRYFLTIRGHYGNFVDIFRISPEKEWMRKFVVAWAELPEKYDKRKTKNVKFNWHPYPEEKPEEFGNYILTVKNKKKRNISTSHWFNNTRDFCNEDDEQILAWAKFPEPYKEKNNG